MQTARRLIRLHACTSVFALVLALLWSVGWGQVHRVLHPASPSYTVADASGKALVAELGDEHGSSLCQLLDHLTHGAGPATTMAVFLADCPAQSPDGRAPAREHLTTRRSFDARGPPPLA